MGVRLAAIGSAVAFACTAAPAVASAATLHVAPGGDDAGACDAAAPCRTLNAAYAVAAPGDTVELAAGSYPRQELRGASLKEGDNVVFRPAGSSHVVVDGISVERSRVTL